MTLFADHPGTLSAALLLPTGFICFVLPPHQSGTPLPSSGTFPTRTPPTSLRPASDSLNDKRQRTSSSRTPETTRTTTRLPALSTYRAHMMLVTVLAILAVDFPVFPRALAKCETYGVSFVRPGFLLFRVFNPFLIPRVGLAVDGHGRRFVRILPRDHLRDPNHRVDQISSAFETPAHVGNHVGSQKDPASIGSWVGPCCAGEGYRISGEGCLYVPSLLEFDILMVTDRRNTSLNTAFTGIFS